MTIPSKFYLGIGRRSQSRSKNLPTLHISAANKIMIAQANKERTMMISIRNQNGPFFVI